MAFVSVSSKGGISLLLISHEGLEGHALRHAIHLVRRVRYGPVHFLLESFHGFFGQLDFAMAGLAILQLLYVFVFKSEATEIRKLRWFTELSNRQKVWKLT